MPWEGTCELWENRRKRLIRCGSPQDTYETALEELTDLMSFIHPHASLIGFDLHEVDEINLPPDGARRPGRHP